MPSEMVERCAQAIGDSPSWDGEPMRLTLSGGEMQAMARAAIEAMRTPTEAMVDAGLEAQPDHMGDDVLADVWRAMLDAALSDAEHPTLCTCPSCDEAWDAYEAQWQRKTPGCSRNEWDVPAPGFARFSRSMGLADPRWRGFVEGEKNI